MNDLNADYRIEWHDRMRAISRQDWDALALPLATPFLEWDWLELLESSGSIGPASGWTPQHLTVWHDGRLVAAAPFYIKTDSEAEFIFDRPWAEVAARIGARYYPKLVGAVPVTPLSGYRFLTAPDHAPRRLIARMAEAVSHRCQHLDLGGCSVLFADPDWWPQLTRHRYCAWHHHGFVWQNEGYTDFEDFLSRFKSGQRRNIRRERDRLSRSGVRVAEYRGEAIPDSFFPIMYDLYARTNRRYAPWGGHYLTEAFFAGLAERWRHRLLFMAVGSDGPVPSPAGMAMLVHKGPMLYGRYWGGDDRLAFLHFETCYYRPVEWAIANGITCFDPGMGGAHKLRRGFVSRPTLSLHRFVDPRLAAVMATHIDRINHLERRQIELLNAAMPFKSV